MKNNEKHIVDINKMLHQISVNDYQPSSGFVDDIMTKVNDIEIEKSPNRFFKIGFQLAAACAIVVFVSNAFIILSSIRENSSETNDWASVYETNNTANWFDYENDDTFLANNQITK